MQNQGIHGPISAHSPFHSLSPSRSLALCKLISFHTILSLSPYHLLSSVSCIHSFGKDSSVCVQTLSIKKNHSCKLQIPLPSRSPFLHLSINPSQACEAYVMVIFFCISEFLSLIRMPSPSKADESDSCQTVSLFLSAPNEGTTIKPGFSDRKLKRHLSIRMGQRAAISSNSFVLDVTEKNKWGYIYTTMH